jgi:SAM-dependent methyltransferase
MKKLDYPSYQDYRDAQVRVNETKLESVWADRAELEWIASYVGDRVPGASFGVCHGARNGYEVEVFRELLGIEVIGTDISPTASGFPHLVQWDFHEPNPQWIGAVDFVYSNSWDHSYDFDRCLRAWMESLRPGGRCFLSWTRLHSDEGVHDADCLGLSLPELESRIEALGYTVEARFTSWKKLLAGNLSGIVRDYVDFLRRERKLGGPRLKVLSLVIVNSPAQPIPRSSIPVTGDR